MIFYKHPTSGTIRTSAVLDREEQAKYWLTIEASDSSIRPLTAVLHVFVRVLDKNDHRPQANQPAYYAQVKENSPAVSELENLDFFFLNVEELMAQLRMFSSMKLTKLLKHIEIIFKCICTN